MIDNDIRYDVLIIDDVLMIDCNRWYIDDILLIDDNR